MSTLARSPGLSLPHSLGLLGAALLAGLAAQGCSLEAQPLLPEEAPLEVAPPLLEFEAPYAGLRYSEADDERPGEPGIQLPVRVRVNDLANGVAIEELEILCAESDARRFVSVDEDELGHRFAELPALTFEPGGTVARFTIVARAGRGLPEAAAGIEVAGR